MIIKTTRFGRLAFAIVLSLCMVVTMMPAMVWAEGEPEPGSKENPISLSYGSRCYDEDKPIRFTPNEPLYFNISLDGQEEANEEIECRFFADRKCTEGDDSWFDRLSQDEYNVEVYESGNELAKNTNKNGHYELKSQNTYLVKMTYTGSSPEDLYVYWSYGPGTEGYPMQIKLDKLSDGYVVDNNESVYYYVSAEDGTICKVSLKDTIESYDGVGEHYELKVWPNDHPEDELEANEGWYTLTGDDDDTYCLSLKYTGETQETVQIKLIEKDSDGDEDSYERIDRRDKYVLNYDEFQSNGFELPDGFRANTTGTDAIRTQIINAYQELTPHVAQGARNFSIIDPICFGTFNNDDGDGELTMAQDASNGILNYLRELYRTDGVEFQNYNQQVTRNSDGRYGQPIDESGSYGIDHRKKPFVPWYEIEVYGVVSNGKQGSAERFLQGIKYGNEYVALYWSEYPDVPDLSDEDAYRPNFEDDEVQLIENTEELRNSLDNDFSQLKLSYFAKAVIRVPVAGTTIPDDFYNENKHYPDSVQYDCNYCGFIRLAERDFNCELKTDVADSATNNWLAQTLELRQKGWNYSDLCNFNLMIQDLISDNTAQRKYEYANSFFEGAFSGTYKELIGSTGLVIKAELPERGFGNPLNGAKEYQGHYYNGDQLYFLDSMNNGIEYDSFMVVDEEKVDPSNGGIAAAAQERLQQYVKGSGINVAVKESDSGWLLSEGRYYTPSDEKFDEEHVLYGSGDFPTSMKEFVEGKDPYELFEYIGEETIASWDDEENPELIEIPVFKLYDVTMTWKDKEQTITFAIAKAATNTVEAFDKVAYGSDHVDFTGGQFSSLDINAETGIVPFDIYIDNAEPDDVDDQWDGQYTAFDITPESNISDSADGHGVDGYSMNVTAKDVKLGNNTTALKQGDTFCVWDDTNSEYVKDENGNVQVFIVGENGAVEFDAHHFSTYAIIPECTHENLIYNRARAATATTSGNLENWECALCHEHFKDSDKQEKYKNDEWFIPAKGGRPAPSPKTDEQKFAEAKTAALAECTALAEANKDSKYPYIAKLIEEAEKSIEELSYDKGKTLEENEAALTAIIDKLKADVAAQKDLDDKASATAAKVKKIKVTQKALKTYKKGHKIKITFKRAKVSGKKITSYQIYRKSSKNGTYKRIKTVTAKSSTVSYTNKSLKKGRRYYYKVRGVVTLANGSKAYTQFSIARSIKCK